MNARILFALLGLSASPAYPEQVCDALAMDGSWAVYLNSQFALNVQRCVLTVSEGRVSSMACFDPYSVRTDATYSSLSIRETCYVTGRFEFNDGTRATWFLNVAPSRETLAGAFASAGSDEKSSLAGLLDDNGLLNGTRRPVDD